MSETESTQPEHVSEWTKESAGSSGHFTTSFGLLERLPQLKVGFDVVAVLDLMVIALLVGLLFTRFVMLPGVRVDLPKTELRMPQNVPDVAVLTIGNQGMLLFAGGVYEIGTIERAFQRYMEDKADLRAVVLIKAQASIDLQTFMNLCEMAQKAGFVQGKLSGKEPEPSTSLIPTGATVPGGTF